MKLFVLLQIADVTDPDCLGTVDLTTCKVSVVKKSPKPLPFTSAHTVMEIEEFCRGTMYCTYKRMYAYKFKSLLARRANYTWHIFSFSLRPWCSYYGRPQCGIFRKLATVMDYFN